MSDTCWDGNIYICSKDKHGGLKLCRLASVIPVVKRKSIKQESRPKHTCPTDGRLRRWLIERRGKAKVCQWVNNVFALSKHITNMGRCCVCSFNAPWIRLNESIKSAGVRWAKIPLYISINLKPIGAWLRGSWISLIKVSLCLCLQLTSITGLTSDYSFWTASNGGPTAVRNPTHTHLHTYKSGSTQRLVSIALYLRSLKFNDLLHPLSYHINYNINPHVADIVWPFMPAVQATSALRGCDKTWIITFTVEGKMV